MHFLHLRTIFFPLKVISWCLKLSHWRRVFETGIEQQPCWVIMLEVYHFIYGLLSVQDFNFCIVCFSSILEIDWWINKVIFLHVVDIILVKKTSFFICQFQPCLLANKCFLVTPSYLIIFHMIWSFLKIKFHLGWKCGLKSNMTGTSNSLWCIYICTVLALTLKLTILYCIFYMLF